MKQFKAESKRLLDLMINSIYTNKEIFLRELISNGSDAIDKLHFASLTDGDVKSDFCINIEVNKDARTLIISDNGIGMTDKEMEANLGTIAASGTLKFKEQNKTDEKLIGQFGVGFYSAFMVADKITVISKAYKQDEGNMWESAGADGYTITPSPRDEVGTTIIMHIKEDDEEFEYSKFLSEYEVKSLVKKYSDYIRFPIKMEMTHSKKKEDSEEYEDVREVETLNSMVPIWKRGKSKVTKEEYDEFYSTKFHDYTPPLKVISANIEGNINYNALLFIPTNAPFDYYSKDYQKGLYLFSNGVMIMEKCSDLLPDCFGFIKGIIDSGDLSLNISREILQKDRQLLAISKSLEKKIISELEKMLKNEREDYAKMFGTFGVSIKLGAYDNYGAMKDQLKDLLLYSTTVGDKTSTLKEYIERMKEGQEYIYYAAGESKKKIKAMPQTEKVLDKGFEIMLLTDKIDEFVIKVLAEYEGKKFKSVFDKDAVTDKDAEEDVKKATDDNKELLDKMKEVLKGKVKSVRFTARLSSHAVCLTSDSEISIEMEKVLKGMPGGDMAKAERVLEINASHPIVERLKSEKDNADAFKSLTLILYNCAELIEGISIESPSEFVSSIINRI